jgi:predicted O-methyltransferase YrrM
VNFQRYTRFPDRRVAAEAALGAVMSRAGGRFLRRRLPASMEELTALADEPRIDARDLLSAGGWFANGDLSAVEAEHRRVAAELAERYAQRSLGFPTQWAVEHGTALLLYALVRVLKPETVLEIGVANGASSYFILRALDANGTGTLHSFDIAPDAGSLLSDADRAAWRFHHITEDRTLQEYLAKLPQAGLCFHDADHEYLAQLSEFTAFWNQLTDDGVLVGDDIDASYAWIHFCESVGRSSEILLDRRKAVGVLAKKPAG